jgi:hypothetical protein
LNFSAELGCRSGGGFVEGVAVGVAEDEEVDVADRAGSLVFVVAGGPGAEDERFLDPRDLVERGAEDGRRSECFEEHVGEPGVVRAIGVGPDQAKVPQPPAHHQTGLLSPLDLPVDGGVGEMESFGQGCQGHFDARVAEDGREDLALLA